MKEAQTFEQFNQDLADFHQVIFKKRNHINPRIKNIDEFCEKNRKS
ncbi:hypothetical protein [Helicobacter pylori]|nr:hypothetical protein [Helicobacter pylori]EQK96671.1 hypothetical protein N201_06525 [Helicobacter pylori UM066]WQW20193.1 hypothetical protein KVL77_04670 [Helicobacter pylori]